MPLEVLQDKERLKSLKQMLHKHSVPAAEALIERKPDGAVQCFACGHRCVVQPGRDGVCRVRFNENGTLLVPHGYVGALACDPIEKKPFFHVLPGSDALTFGMLGCDYHCGYCQNWVTSQMLRDPKAVAPARLCYAEATGRSGDSTRCAGGRVELQRAADHQRVGGRCVQGSAGAESAMRVHQQRQRHAAGAGFYSAARRCVQGRSQDIRSTNTIASSAG